MMSPIDVRVSRVALGFLATTGALVFSLAILERELIMLASSLLFAAAVALGLGYKVRISGSFIRGGVRVLGLQISAWDIDLRRAEVVYLLPRWLGPLSILVVSSEKQNYYVTPVLRGRKRIIEHIQLHGREAAA